MQKKRTRIDAVPFTRDARNPSCALIVKVASEFFSLDPKYFKPDKTSTPIVKQWRHIVWYLCRKVAIRPYPAIMRAVGGGGKDASSIRDGVKAIEKKLEEPHKGIALTIVALRLKIMEAHKQEQESPHGYDHSADLPRGDRPSAVQPGDGG